MCMVHIRLDIFSLSDAFEVWYDSLHWQLEKILSGLQVGINIDPT